MAAAVQGSCTSHDGTSATALGLPVEGTSALEHGHWSQLGARDLAAAAAKCCCEAGKSRANNCDQFC